MCVPCPFVELAYAGATRAEREVKTGNAGIAYADNPRPLTASKPAIAIGPRVPVAALSWCDSLAACPLSEAVSYEDADLGHWMPSRLRRFAAATLALSTSSGVGSRSMSGVVSISMPPPYGRM